MIRVCENTVCEKTFQTYPAVVQQGRGRYCSRSCVDDEKKRRTRAAASATCHHCGAQFIARTRLGRFCSRRCHGLSRINRVKKICPACGVEMYFIPSDLRQSPDPCCSRSCRTAYERKKRGWEPPASPAGAHWRCKDMWGRASQYPCVECGGRAKDWAYDGTDPTQGFEKMSKDGSWCYFSLCPEFYMPMCRKCHRIKDAALASQELREYRIWKTKTGLTLDDVKVIRSINMPIMKGA